MPAKRLTKRQFGERLRSFRESTGVSQEKLANVLGVPRQSIGQIEKGERDVNGRELVLLADYFNVTPRDLLSARSEKQNKARGSGDLSVVKFDAKKLRNLLLFILAKCGGQPNLGETVLYKILYFIDFDAFEIFGRAITGLRYKHIQFGPVPVWKEFSSVAEKMKERKELAMIQQEYFGKQQKRYIALVEPEMEMFDRKELDLIEKELQRLCAMNAIEIENYSHGDVPWKNTADGELIDYRLVFERDLPYAHRNYRADWQSAAGEDILKDLGRISEAEARYYEDL